MPDFVRHEIRGFRLTGFDKLLIVWGLVALICGLIREPSAEVFGIAYNNLGTYFLFRVLMREDEDVSGYFSIFAVLGCIFGACMLYEDLTRHNPFHIFGGVPEITIIRGDRFRCQGAFRQPILAGTFGATLFPLMVAYWQQAGSGRERWLAILGGIFSMVITVTSASSGPLLTLLAAFAGFAMWPVRRKMRLFRRGVVATIIALSLVMKAHVWFVIDRISSLTGGGGYYRSDLIEKFVNHFSEWWFIGTSNTVSWATAGIVLASNPNMVDITNHYIEQGVSGGLIEFCLFLAMIVICFKIVGRAVWSESEWSYRPRLAWAIGVTLACHCTAFISVSYFDQIQVFWFWLLAAIAAIPAQAYAGPRRNRRLEPARNLMRIVPQSAPAFDSSGRV